jgi:diguanylate cyclase (GGDEF)-like protein
MTGPANAPPQSRRLQTRIVVAFTALLFTLQAAAFLIVSIAGTTTAKSNLANDLVIGERVFNRSVDQRAAQLEQGARILSTDFAFREAVATRDRATVGSVLANHGARIGADLMLLMDLDRKVVADTSSSSTTGQTSPLAWMVDIAEAKGTASTMVRLDGRIYQVVVMPVRAPVPIAWVAMGFLIDDRNADDLKKLTNLEVSFLESATADGWRLQGSTLRGIQRADLLTSMSTVAKRQGDDPFIIALDGADYMTLLSTETTAGDGRIVAVLQKPLDTALAPFRDLQRRLLLVTSVAVLIAILSSLLIARSIARPVRLMAIFARRVASGDYLAPLDIHREDEIGELALAFDDMRERITDREKHILDLAYRDALTGLPNRLLFSDRLNQAIATARRLGRPLTVVMMDLDRFKYVNDSLGHQGGDLLLVEVGRRLQDVVRRKSDTIARMGGDEFAVLLPTEATRDVMGVVRKLQEALETPITIEGHLVDARASIGVATFPEHGEDLVALLRHADSAMYLAKRNNTGVAIYDPHFDEDSRERLSLMSELRQAVERDELVLYYQPKIDLNVHGALHAEALVRWIHATRGFVRPDQFIPFAEQTGYISTITEWVLDKAMTQLRQWHDGGLDIRVSVNISTRDVMDGQFPARLATLLEQHGCEADWLELEITETAIVTDPVQAQANIDRLHALGCRISIDDFGTGYSSLAYLKRLSVDELKIDKSFVMGMAADPSDAVIIRSTIDLGHNMGLKVVAEGVETESALKQLRAMGCDLAQGYLMSRPIPATELTRWMSESPWIVGRFEPKDADIAIAA